jgi:hypothetical protein
MLHRRLDHAVIYAGFSYKKYHDFQQWKDAAKAGTIALTNWVARHPVKQKGESLPVEAELYQALKNGLIGYFQGKCAYCESEFAHVAWGDVEHYRPKRGVTGEMHPGYYWLAYSEDNLMPSCAICNQGAGKGNHFPIAGRRAMCADDDLAAELPMLLSPYEQDDCEPERHVRFVIEESRGKVLPTGRAEGITERGKESVERYRLNRQALMRRRFKNQKAAIGELDLAEVRRELSQVWAELVGSEQEHASAVRAACRKWLEVHKRQLCQLQIP